jgi:hypothetical protein
VGVEGVELGVVNERVIAIFHQTDERMNKLGALGERRLDSEIESSRSLNRS